MTLKDLNIGETAVVGTVGGEGALRQHFLDMGLIPGEEVTLVKFAPMGDPMELSIHGYELTLRLDDAARIGVTLAKAPAAKKAAAESEKPVEHPGLGEGGRYHTKKVVPHTLAAFFRVNGRTGKSATHFASFSVYST